METKKISKWDAAPKSIKNLRNYILETWKNYAAPPCCPPLDPSCQDSICESIMTLLESVLDEYNRLEAKHQLDCGLISDYAEENARLKQKNEKASNNIRNLRRVLEENDIATYLNPMTVSWGVANVALQKKTEHFNTQLDNLREKLKETEKSKENWIAHYLRNQLEQQRAQTNSFSKSNNDLRRRLLDLRCQLNDNGISSYWSSSSKTNILDFNAYDKNVQSRIDRQEIEDKDKLIEELRQKIEDLEVKTSYYVARITSLERELEKLTNENHVFRLKNLANRTYGLTGRIELLNKEIDDLKVENNNLITDNKRLNNAVDAWFNMFNDMRKKCDSLKEQVTALRRTVKILDGEGYF